MALHRTMKNGLALSSVLKTKTNISYNGVHIINLATHNNIRFASTGDKKTGCETKDNQEGQSQPAKPVKSNWLGKVFSSSSSSNNSGQTSHSRVLSATEYIYEMHYHDARPETSEDYIQKYEKYSSEVACKTNKKAELVCSFRVEIGNQDQFIHIWRYHDGYKEASKLLKLIRTDDTLVKMTRDQLKDLRKRESQFMMAFSFWGHPEPQDNQSYYEMRSYVLKPGTMIEWANGWSRGITHRDNAVAGFFSQIGQLYTVHHIWRYEDLQMRKDVREKAWRRPGWDECVAITVPNIVYLHSRWMSPNSFSPIK